jgi:hypothetical protein
VSYAEKYRLFVGAPGYKRDRRFFLLGFSVTLAASLIVVLLGFQHATSAPRGFGLGAPLWGCFMANFGFWLVWYLVYRFVVPALVPFEKLRAFVQRGIAREEGSKGRRV